MTEEKPGRRPDVFDQAFLTGVPDVTEVILVRHGQQLPPETSGPLGDVFDQPLTEQGQQQARLVGEALSTLKIDAVFSSPLRRAHETALAIAGHHRLELNVMPDLREIELFRDLPRDRPLLEVLGVDLLTAVRQRMLNERSWDVYPHSESSHDFRKRTINAIEAAIARNKGERIAIICHGGVINAYLSHIIGTHDDMFFRPAHTSINIVAAGAHRRALRTLNDVHHLRTAEGDFQSY